MALLPHNIFNPGLINRKGLTLIEIIASAMILAVLAAGVFSAFFGAQRFLNRARHRMQAYNFAVEAMDRLKSNYIYSSAALNTGTGHSATEIDAAGIINGELVGFGGALTYDVESLATGSKQVTIRLNWNEPAF